MNKTNEEKNVTLKTTVPSKSKSRMRIKEISFIGLMGAVSAVLMLFRFPLPFLPPFLSFDLAGLMEILGGFMFGPVAAFLIIVVKIMLQLVMQGSLSLGTGEIQNLILSCAYVMPALLFYHRRKTKKTAALGMAAGTLAVSIVAVFTNLYLIIPFYVKLFGMSMEDIIAMCSAVNPAMKSVGTMAVLGILPFNLIKYGVTSVLTLLIYKRISRPVKAFVENKRRKRKMKFSVDKSISYEDAVKRMFEMLGDCKIMALASSSNDYVMVRNVSCLFYDEKIYFKTDKNFRKTKQLFENPHVAMCWSGVQVEGIAENKGLVVDEPGRRFEEGYKKYLWESYNKYSHEDTEILIEVSPKYVEIWDTSEDGYAYQLFIDFDSKSVEVKPYDKKKN